MGTPDDEEEINQWAASKLIISLARKPTTG